MKTQLTRTAAILAALTIIGNSALAQTTPPPPPTAEAAQSTSQREQSAATQQATSEQAAPAAADNETRDANASVATDAHATSRNQQGESHATRTGKQHSDEVAPSRLNAEHSQHGQAELGISFAQNERGGLEVERVIADSPAEMAGIQVGDQIVAINGEAIRNTQQLVSAIRELNPNDQVELRVDRRGRVRNLITRVSTNVFDRESRIFARSNRANVDRYRYFTPHGHDDLVNYISMLEDDMEELSAEIRALRRMLAQDPEYRESNHSQVHVHSSDR